MKVKATIHIPKGWRKLRAGTIIKPGDRFASLAESEWRVTSAQGFLVGQLCDLYIRRIKK